MLKYNIKEDNKRIDITHFFNTNDEKVWVEVYKNTEDIQTLATVELMKDRKTTLKEIQANDIELNIEKLIEYKNYYYAFLILDTNLVDDWKNKTIEEKVTVVKYIREKNSEVFAYIEKQATAGV